jgi:hypothetical protein
VTVYGIFTCNKCGRTGDKIDIDNHTCGRKAPGDAYVKLKKSGYGPVYAGLYPELADIFKKHGWALAIHGSMNRDFDLLAARWTETPSEPQTIFDEIIQNFAIESITGPQEKPFGRKAWSLHMSFGNCYFDISFIGLATAQQAGAQDE